MVATFKNAGQRQNHRERAQPNERRKLGLLEKRKDYVARAQDYKDKQKKIKRLREKAQERNPDEFYYGMTHKKTKNGVPQEEREDSSIDMDTIKILKTQDIGWIRHHRDIERSKIEELEQKMHMVGAQRFKSEPRKHTLFVDGQKEAIQFDPAKHFQTSAELVNRAENRLRVDQIGEVNMRVEDFSSRLHRKLKEKTARELLLRKKRDSKLAAAEERVQLDRLLQGKGGRQKKKTKDGKPIYKWRNERKR
ncbi:U3 snoRNP-associated protein Utp11 [Schizosaccharomyces octosporus yFS286]|uniref:U3 small nucleolar RNA-associated protein 11 n=1 Tax=Schizosaccharomyces octosporus (strain yFS286) TaxID=483514 RepID=S9QWG3_SCHOY|nr:U3 snoRNP-associated protein Utp11 [Schizosaccharomyces octosporus yFS286]EPX70625.1 U3 snoRNP-associated protein Utp11 [Schizosaccharomyces octosporus yFS286]